MKQIDQKGFTLIEMLVYLALFAIVIGGGIVTVYQIIQNSNSLQAKTVLQEEGNFILAKLNYALTGAAADTCVTIPDSSTLKIDKPSCVPPVATSLTFNNKDPLTGAPDKNLRLNGAVLNSDRAEISALNFSKSAGEEIKAEFTLTTLSNDGKTLSQDFEITKYLRR